MLRIGHGYDVHKVIREKKPLIIGGVEIFADFSLLAHSDGDIVLHALTDALLGAACLGDIGKHFPDTNVKYKNKNSSYFLSNIYSKILKKKYILHNADITIIAEKPRLQPYVKEMQENISSILKLKLSNQINIKSTTSEKLGFIGSGEGIACHAVVLIGEKK